MVRETAQSANSHLNGGEKKKYLWQDKDRRDRLCNPCLPHQHGGMHLMKASVTPKICVAGHQYGPVYPRND